MIQYPQSTIHTPHSQQHIIHPPQTQEMLKPIRRHDLDWLRVILFALLIWFHYSAFSLGQIEGSVWDLPLFFIIGVMHQWRLAALFVISGMGTAFALKRRSAKTYLKERAIRLGIPLFFGVYVLFLGFTKPIEATIQLFTIFPGMDGMPYGHLWFIYNLLIYSVILSPIFLMVKNNPEGILMRVVRKFLNLPLGLGILFIPPLILAVNGILFKPWRLGEVGMWWEFSRYMLYFLFGYLLISAKDDYFTVLNRIRIPLTAMVPILAIAWYILNESSEIPRVMEGGWVQRGYPAFSAISVIASIVQSFHAWFWCMLIFSWASKLLNRPSSSLAYLNEAVYPTYIVHMHLTFLPIAIFGLIGLNYYVGMIIGTIIVMCGVMICFEIVRRTRFARPLFGIRGGQEEVNTVWPFNKITNLELRIGLSIGMHFVALGMVIGLLIFLIASGFIAEL